MLCNDCPEDSTRELALGDRGTTALVNEGESDRLTLVGRDGREYHFVRGEPVAVMNWDLAPFMLRHGSLAIVEVLRG